MGELIIKGRVMPASNATFLCDLDGREVVYKPVSGERPLWDFPNGTLADREVATYLVSEVSGWNIVPRTWWAEGPHGPGMVQEWQDVDPDAGAVDLVRRGATPEGWLEVVDGLDDRDRPVVLIHEDTDALRRMAVFDIVVNNADRKGGHVLAMPDGHRYGVDHGIALHDEPKLRTVLWGWAGSPLRTEEVTVVERIRKAVRGQLGATLGGHLTGQEVAALERRAERLLSAGVLPMPRGEWPPIPWPPF